MFTQKEMNLTFLTILMKESTEKLFSFCFSCEVMFANWLHLAFLPRQREPFLYLLCEPFFKISELMFSFVHFIYLFSFIIIFAIILAQKAYINL